MEFRQRVTEKIRKRLRESPEVLLMGFAVPFAVCHILLSVKNAMAK